MHLSSFASSLRSLVSLVPLALVAGCAVAPASPEEVGEQKSAMASSSIGGGGGIVVVTDPTVLCATTPAQSVTIPPWGWTNVATGDYDAAQGCPYSVTEVTGVQNKSVVLQLVDDPTFHSGDGFSTTPAYCAESDYTYDVFGYVPPHFFFGAGGTIQYYPGYWETIKTGYGYGVWNASTNKCVLAGLAGGGFPAFEGTVTKYTTLRIATSSYEIDANGAKITTQAEPYVLVRP
jgi:hypothetical protein